MPSEKLLPNSKEKVALVVYLIRSVIYLMLKVTTVATLMPGLMPRSQMKK